MKKMNDRIKALREHLGLSQPEFANRAKVSIGSIWNIENGEVTPSAKTLRAIESAFNVNLEWIKTGKGEMLSDKIQLVENTSNVWKDALVSELKEEVSYLRKLLEMAVGNKSGNFRKALELAGFPATENRSRVGIN